MIADQGWVTGGMQHGVSNHELTTAMKPAKHEQFLSEMEVVLPWQALIELSEPYTQDHQEGRTASISTGHHAADKPVAAVVLSQRPGHGRGLNRGAHHAPLGRHRADL